MEVMGRANCDCYTCSRCSWPRDKCDGGHCASCERVNPLGMSLDSAKLRIIDLEKQVASLVRLLEK